MLIAKQQWLVNCYMPLLLHDNARPYTAQQMAMTECLTPNINNLSPTSILDYPISRLDRYMKQSKIDVGDRLLILGVRRPPYSPDLAPRDYHFFQIWIISCKGKDSTPMGQYNSL